MFVATLHPNHTYEKVEFDPWHQDTWDASDTVLVEIPRTTPMWPTFSVACRTPSIFPHGRANGPPEASDRMSKQRPAKRQRTANTPTVAYFDSLGRTFLTIAHNNRSSRHQSSSQRYRTLTEFDIEGNQRQVVDAKGRSRHAL